MLSPFRDVDLVDPRLLLALRHDLVREFLDDAAERDEAVDRVDVVLAAHMLRLEKPVGDRHPLLFRSAVDDTQPFLERRGRLADVARVAGERERVEVGAWHTLGMPGPPRRRRQIEGDRRPCHQSVRSELSPVNGSGSSPVCFRSCCCASSSSLASSKSSSSPPACEPSSAISSISSSMPSPSPSPPAALSPAASSACCALVRKRIFTTLSFALSTRSAPCDMTPEASSRPLMSRKTRSWSSGSIFEMAWKIFAARLSTPHTPATFS